MPTDRGHLMIAITLPGMPSGTQGPSWCYPPPYGWGHGSVQHEQ